MKNVVHYRSDMTITAPAHISKLSTMADRTIRVQVDISRELPDEEMAILFGLRNTSGTMAFKEGAFTDGELDVLPDYKPEFKNDKTPAQRMRAVLYRLWEYEGSKDMFEQYYVVQMEKIINSLKSKLP